MKGTYFEKGVHVDESFKEKLKPKSLFSIPLVAKEALEKSILKGKIIINNKNNKPC